MLFLSIYNLSVYLQIGAGNGIRTHDINLGKVALYPWAIPASFNESFYSSFFYLCKKNFHSFGIFLITFCFKPNKNYPQYKIHIYFLNKLYTIMPYYIKHIILPLKMEQSCQKKTAKRVFKTRVLKKKPKRWRKIWKKENSRNRLWNQKKTKKRFSTQINFL